MKEVEVFYWLRPNPNPRGKPVRTRWKLTREEALSQFGPAAQPDVNSREVRQVATTPEEVAVQPAISNFDPVPAWKRSYDALVDNSKKDGE